VKISLVLNANLNRIFKILHFTYKNSNNISIHIVLAHKDAEELWQYELLIATKKQNQQELILSNTFLMFFF